jgi:SPP1 gp7 family putative phage head morphogenesis protein
MLPHYRASMRLSFDDANELLSEYDVDVSFNLKNPRVKDTIAGLLTRVKSVAGTTKEEVRDIIAKGLDEGLSPAQISARIREKAPELSRYRAERIARTETADAYTRGSILAYQDSGVVSQVEWNSTLDNRTSDVCQGLHGKRVDLGKAFEGGFGGPPAHPNEL